MQGREKSSGATSIAFGYSGSPKICSPSDATHRGVNQNRSSDTSCTSVSALGSPWWSIVCKYPRRLMIRGADHLAGKDFRGGILARAIRQLHQHGASPQANPRRPLAADGVSS
jgi:hypothetical protein